MPAAGSALASVHAADHAETIHNGKKKSKRKRVEDDEVNQIHALYSRQISYILSVKDKEVHLQDTRGADLGPLGAVGSKKTKPNPTKPKAGRADIESIEDNIPNRRKKETHNPSKRKQVEGNKSVCWLPAVCKQ